MSVLCILAAVAAFALFGLSTDAHHRRWFGTAPSASRRRTLRRGAWLAVVACCTCALAAHGAVYGPVFWIGALMVGAATIFLILNLTPQRKPRRIDQQGTMP
jgi:hypothetical protein